MAQGSTPWGAVPCQGALGVHYKEAVLGGPVGDLEGILVEGPHRAWREGRVDLEALDNLPDLVLAQGKEVLPTSRLKNEKFRF